MARNMPARSDGGSGRSGFFSDLLGFDPFRAAYAPQSGAPNPFGMEISRSDREYTIEIPVPGFRPEQIEVTVQDDTLMISGKGDRRSFTRSLTLPEEIDTDSILANVDHGMLSLKLQQRPEASPRRIQVQSGPRQATGVTGGAGSGAGSETISASTAQTGGSSQNGGTADQDGANGVVQGAASGI